jgi:hypothetical protein
MPKEVGGPPDPFDPANMNFNQSFDGGPKVRKILVNVPVVKPNKKDFIRVHPTMFSPSVVLVEVENDAKKDVYYITPAIARMGVIPSGDATIYDLRLYCNRKADIFVWPMKLQTADGSEMDWFITAKEVAKLAETQWLRVQSNKAISSYEPLVAEDDLGDPTWPDLEWSAILRIAFKNKVVEDLENPLFGILRGRK